MIHPQSLKVIYFKIKIRIATRSKRYDAGDKRGYLKAIVDFALEREDLKGEIEKYLREIWKRGKEGIT